MVHSESIMVGGHLLSGRLQGADYKVTRLGGWWNRPNVKRAELSRELADGDFPQPWHFEARYISIDGYVDCLDHAQMHHIMDQLNGLAVTRREYLTVQGHGQMSSALVEADGGALVEPVTDKLLRFELRFKANDPRKYGELRTADMGPTWAGLRHYGNYLASPVFRLYALGIGDAGFDIQADVPSVSSADGVERRVWRYQSWTNNAWHDIDFSTGMHRVAGNTARSNVTIAQTWGVPAHEPVSVRVRPRLAAGGTVYGTVSWRDTWI